MATSYAHVKEIEGKETVGPFSLDQVMTFLEGESGQQGECGAIDVQSFSMERRWRGGVQLISTYFRARHEVRIRY